MGGQSFGFFNSIQKALGALGDSMLREPTKDAAGKNCFSYGGQTIIDELIGNMKHAGKKMALVVNVASKWGLTDANYKDLVQTYTQF